MSRYDHLIHTFKPDFIPPHQTYFRGHDCMPDSNFYSNYRCYSTESFIDRWPTFHTEDELLCWVGYDLADPWGSFDAEIEFWIGEDRNNMVQYIITEPTICRVPAYVWHCPLEYRRVGKPVYFQLVLKNGKFGTYSQKIDSDGKKHLVYSSFVANRQCVYDSSKKCTLCGKCRATEDAVVPKSAAEAMEMVKSGM
ncbi:MAG: hypothetical protein FWH33_05440 [Oscillospiraceae bacterium]|nr:hypothetical protein [Oscillospiraceae bacterium]